jgi:hypothetical protein
MGRRVAAQLDSLSARSSGTSRANITNRAVPAVSWPQLETLGLTYRLYLVMPTGPGVERKELEHLAFRTFANHRRRAGVGVLDSEQC